MTEETQESVILTYEGRIAYLMLNRPRIINALNEEMLTNLRNKLKEVASSNADVVILHGSGNGFSAGGDIKSMLEVMDKDKFDGIMDTISELVLTLYTLPKIVISAVHGAAAGLGFSLALATDYIIAEGSTTFAMNFIKIGLIPDGGSHFFLTKKLGEVKAKQLIWEGKNLSTQDVFEQHLINEIVEKDALGAAKLKAEAFLTMPIRAMVETKKIIVNKNIEELRAVLELEKQSQYQMRVTKDHREGITAFLEKRKPHFIGQ